MKDKKLSARLDGDGNADKNVKNATNARAAHGRIGEDAAAAFLERSGYTVKGRNVRFGRHELDIIAEDDEYLVFVEVKTRSSGKFGDPSLAVDITKQRKVCRAATAYLKRFGKINAPARFDVISIIGDKVEHILNAFDTFYG